MKKRSISYPSHSLFSTKDFVIAAYEAGASQTPMKYEDLNKIGAVPVREIAYFCSTAAQYGWSESIYGKGHQVNAEICKILRKPQGNEEKEQLLKAFTTPEIYKRIISDWNNKEIISVDALEIYLSRNFEFSDTGSRQCAEIFMENAKGLGIIGEDNLFRIDSEIVLNNPIKEGPKAKQTKSSRQESQSNEKPKSHKAPVKIESPAHSTPSHDNAKPKHISVFVRGIELKVPILEDMTQTDWDHFIKQLNNIKSFAR